MPRNKRSGDRWFCGLRIFTVFAHVESSDEFERSRCTSIGRDGSAKSCPLGQTGSARASIPRIPKISSLVIRQPHIIALHPNGVMLTGRRFVGSILPDV